ncbi:PHA/PHB synthase family protein [Mycobacterium branderi]|uniref:Class II poly(R)-hydroxyalkanoic acid synthase n=1 Tax=Mycobacterium branderi TaxID=43348 RepID=A0A7I7W4Y7_9MYCO|nr:alpha/beta fold hydrolase [Mycobacterium branderi]MCV7235954.1 alpha/beta fold hydrolase [Mycobacterium branderi]ORA34700.1 poly(3-hydroxyalkanoate) polymerase [Mycobacterium branderi]BBZ12629.1 class II poly(R)-hydroxyalkanoic acid synthase [Mycobacterium branderi]
MTATKPDELAAPLDLLLTSATRPFARRMMPNAVWARFGANLAKQPGAVAGRAGTLVRELGSIAVGRSHRAPDRADKRFSDPAWQGNPLLHRIMQAYLAAAETGDGLLDDAGLDWRDAEKMRFVVDNLVEGLAPTNNPLISPLGWKALIDTGGLSAVRGARAFVRDMLSKPRVPAMVEPDAFAVGETVAITKGAVVAQTSMFELIQYAPQTPTVRSIPLLIVPPVINKFYVLDIAPGRSLIEYFVQQGQQVFVISWRNPQARHRDWGFDAYGSAIIEALDAVQKIAGADSAHLLATCSGGILAAMTASHLAQIGEADRIAGLTLAVTVLDQTRAGFASAVMSERAAQAAIRTSAKKGYLDGRAMAEMFAWLRPTDLVWRYWVNNYVQGRPPAPFDVLFWNADTTRMTAALHRDMVLMGVHNSLVTPGAVSMLGSPVDLSKVTADAYVIGGIADHISPWQATYRSARLLGSKDNQYVLSTSGHIAALVNPPGNPKASYRTGAVDAEDPQEWLDTAQKFNDSWWPHYLAWLAERSGPEVDAPKTLGGEGFPPLGPAPGTYVMEK